MLVWETVKQQTSDGRNLSGYIYRAKVSNGWLVKEVQDCGFVDTHQRYVDGYSWTSSITFVPDPEHKWEV
jgi:hypothetical protein